jgi:hypothetical protein
MASPWLRRPLLRPLSYDRSGFSLEPQKYNHDLRKVSTSKPAESLIEDHRVNNPNASQRGSSRTPVGYL